MVATAKSEKLDEAYDYLQVSSAKDIPIPPAWSESYENYLYEEAKISHRNQKYDEALALLRQIFAKNPKRQGLDKAMGVETEKLVEQYVAQHRYDAARTLIQELAKAFPNHPVAAAWSEQIRNQAETYLREAQAAARKGRLDQGLRAMPAVDGALARPARREGTCPGNSSKIIRGSWSA